MGTNDKAGKAAITGSCHCGRVRFTMATPPAEVTRCNCSICSKLGALWTYCPPEDFTVIEGETALTPYSWGDQYLDFRFCGSCGCMVQWRMKPEFLETVWPSPADRKTGINARLIDGLDAETLPVREVDGRGA